MRYLIYSQIFLGLLIFNQPSAQPETNLGKTKNSIEKCELVLTINNEGEFLYSEKTITKNEISELVKRQLLNCGSKSSIKIFSGMELGYLVNHEKLENLILNTITDLQNNKSIEKFGIPLDSTSNEQYQMIEKIYPSTIYSEFCCTEH
ncbi:MAG: hypothetical protein NXH73_06400 [Flavobacteriaceae bacterium]|nr:hypothetical protein [Flavobacteriaceae bacterium]